MKKLIQRIIGPGYKQQAASYQQRLGNINRIVIFYPVKPEQLRIAYYSLRRLFNSRMDYRYLLVVPPTAKLHDLEVWHEYHLLDDDFRSADREDSINKINEFKPDLLLQLDPAPSDKRAELVRVVTVPLKAGFGDEDAGLNLIQAQKEYSFYEKNILNLVRLVVGE